MAIGLELDSFLDSAWWRSSLRLCYKHHAAPAVRYEQWAQLPTPAPDSSLAPLGDGGELDLAACAAPACKSDGLLVLLYGMRYWFFSPPVGLSQEAQAKADQRERLSEQSEFEFDPVFGNHRRLPETKRKDPDHRGETRLVEGTTTSQAGCKMHRGSSPG